MDYSKQLGMISEFLKPFCKDLKRGDVVQVYIDSHVTLSVSGGFGGDVRITDTSGAKHHNYNEYTKWSAAGSTNERIKEEYADGKNSEYFGHFRRVPDNIARTLILNWQEIKQRFIDNYQRYVNENKQIEEFEV